MAEKRENAKSAAEEPTCLPNEPGTEPETATLRSAARESPGESIGPYKLLDELGAGGMGTVYLAEQEKPVQRRVALKVIKPGLDTSEVIARFEAERQALALMDHANIARVLDAGTTNSGRPYFVMELVQGVPITRYCDAHRVPVRERLELFLPVCRAIQHAHQKGIIHRDLKPSNILVTLRDDQPTPKIIDFGIAKATTQRLTEKTLFTRHGQLVGTPDYMSPEQAGLGGLDVDTRSDVYSLGAVLYELLCGDTPLGRARLKQLDYVSMLNVIYEEEPLTPSRRVTEVSDSTTDLARRRDVEPQRLSQSLRGELDWIVSKALEKERTRRYDSASSLAADIERHLANEPVEACPPSKVYRLRKFVRRNRAALAAAAMIAAVLVGGIIASTWQAVRARRAEQDMANERQAALVAQREAEDYAEQAAKAEEAAVEREKEAEAARQLAEDRQEEVQAALAQVTAAAERERLAREEIALRLRVADAMRLAMQSKDAREQFPQRALLLAAEAVEATRRSGEPIIPAAQQALRDALNAIGGRPLFDHGDRVHFMQVTPDGNSLITGGNGVRIWDLAADDPAESVVLVGGEEFAHWAMAIGPKGRWLVTRSTANANVVLHLWDLQAKSFAAPARTLRTPNLGNPQQVSFSPDARWLAATFRNRALLWDLAADDSNTAPVVIGSNEHPFRNLAISADNRWVVTYEQWAATPSICLWPLEGDSSPSPIVLADEDELPRNVQVSPDGKWLAASGRSAEPWLRLWELTAADPIQSTREVADSVAGIVPINVNSLQFTPDSRHLITTQQYNISLWPLSAEALQSPPVNLSPRQAQTVVRTGFSNVVAERDGRSLVAINHDGTILHWDLMASDPQSTVLVVGRHPGGSGAVLRISPSGRWLISAPYNSTPQLWDLSGRNELAVGGLPLTGHDGGVNGAENVVFGGESGTFSNVDARWLITRGDDATPRLWDLTAPDPSRAGVGSGVLQFSGMAVVQRPDGQWVITGGRDARVLDPANGPSPVSKEISIRPPQGSQSWSGGDVPLSGDGRWLVTNHQEELSIWDLADERLLAAQPADQGKGMLNRIWNLEIRGPGVDTSTPHQIIKAPSNATFGPLHISPGGRWVCTQGAARRMQLWPLSQGDPDAQPIELGLSDRLPVFSPDGRWLVAFGQPRAELFSRLWNLEFSDADQVYLWDLSANPPRPMALPIEGQQYTADDSVAFSGDGRWLAARMGNEIGLWELGEEGPLGDPEILRDDSNQSIQFRQVAISRDGRWVAATTSALSSGGVVHAWDRNAPEADAAPRVLRGHEESIAAMTFSPDARWLATASSDGQVRLWSLVAAQPEETALVFHAAGVSRTVMERLHFSIDDNWLAAAGGNTVYFWPLDVDRLLSDVFRLAGRELNTGEIERYRLDAGEVLRDQFARRADRMSDQLEENPQDLSLLRERINLLTSAGQLEEAIDDLDLLVRLEPSDHWPQYRRLSLLAQTGRAEAYRRACDALAAKFIETETLEIYERVAKGHLFWAESGMEWTKAAALADRALAKATEASYWVLPWTHVAKGFSEYRLGNDAEALNWVERGLADPTRENTYSVAVPGNLVKAMALMKLGRPEEAQAAFDEAKRRHDQFATPGAWLQNNWHDWHMCEVMFREAEGVLASATSAEAMSASLP